ncbi:MAG: hypothetical protein JO304_09030 [Solirubrobacterales bacterium]|nr:hypothetical protein [Solirubrobacterales bacterium]
MTVCREFWADTIDRTRSCPGIPAVVDIIVARADPWRRAVTAASCPPMTSSITATRVVLR